MSAPCPICLGAVVPFGWWYRSAASFVHNRLTFEKPLRKTISALAERYARRTIRFKEVLERKPILPVTATPVSSLRLVFTVTRPHS